MMGKARKEKGGRDKGKHNGGGWVDRKKGRSEGRNKERKEEL